MSAVARDLRDFFPEKERKKALGILEKDKAFQKQLEKHGIALSDLFVTTYPLKYLGIELGEGGKPRFTFEETLRIALHPRSFDGASKGLRYSVHRKAFIEAFPDIDALLSASSLFSEGSKAPLESFKSLKKSSYSDKAQPPLLRLEEYTGIPSDISLQVLRKGLAAYKHGHRPNMTAHGWARARLTSFVMKGCTHYFPDHKLVEKAKTNKKAKTFWRNLKCLCQKEGQCGFYGKKTAANSAHHKRN